MSGAERTMGAPLLLMNYPTREQRLVLQARHRALAQHMSQRDNSAIADAITTLIGCYRNALKPGEDVRPVTAKYVKELAGLPTWACVRACDAIRDHKYADCITFLPSTIRLREIAASYCASVTREATEIYEVLRGQKAPEPVSGEARERIKLGFQSLSERLRSGAAVEAEKPRFKPYTDDELRRMYAKPESATDSEMSHVKQSEAAE